MTVEEVLTFRPVPGSVEARFPTAIQQPMSKALPCPVCHQPGDLEDRLALAKNERDQHQRNWAQLVFLMLGEYKDAEDSETRRLRADAADLLREARDREQANQIAIDEQVAVSWAQERLADAESRLSTAQSELQAHHERQSKLASIVNDLDALNSRAVIAAQERDRSRDMDARLDWDAKLVAVQRLTEHLSAEAQALRVPCDPLVLQSRIDEASMDVVSARRLVDSPSEALSAYVEHYRRTWSPAALQQTLALRRLDISRLAFEVQP